MPSIREVAADRGIWGGLEPVSRMTAVPPFEIHSLEFGSGEQEVVLLHGLSGSAGWWHRNVPDLARHYRVLLPELIGFGRSRRSSPLPGMAATSELLDRWMAKMELGTVQVIGHSMGGQIAIHLAARYPYRVDRLVLADAAGIPRPLNPAAVLRFAFQAAPLWRWGDPRFLPTIARDTWTAGPRTVLAAIAHILTDDVRPLLGQIRAPTLIVWGEGDALVPLDHARQMRSGIRDSRLAVVRGASHNVMIDRPGEFNRAVLRFFGGESVGS
jgi:pimeloyl-ACP methyl ester carboxylesterase